MTCSVLSINQSPTELDRIYEENYYIYLHGPEFHRAFLSVVGLFATQHGSRCLDVGCGEGWLAPYVLSDYVGIDGSSVAIYRAKRNNLSHKEFHVRRIESPGLRDYRFDLAIFGNLFTTCIKAESQLGFIKSYIEYFDLKKFILYDLQQLDTSQIDATFRRICYYEASVDVPDIQEVKRHRKVLVYRCF